MSIVLLVLTSYCCNSAIWTWIVVTGQWNIQYSFFNLFAFNIVNCHHLKMNSLCPSCDKKRGSMNNTNWIRHKESCHKKTKTVKKTASSTISKYFNKIEVIEQPRK